MYLHGAFYLVGKTDCIKKCLIIIRDKCIVEEVYHTKVPLKLVLCVCWQQEFGPGRLPFAH